MPDFIVTEDGTVIVPRIDYGRFCVRCGAPVYHRDPEHLCADVMEGLRLDNELGWAEYARSLVVHGGEA